MVRRTQFLNFASTTLNGGINASVTSITVTDGSVFPAEGDYPLIINDEVVLVTARATNVLTVVRGQDDTTAASHSDTDTIKTLLTASNITDYIDEGIGVGVHAQSGNSARVPFRLLNDSGTKLTSSDFTWVNQGTSSVADNPGGPMTVTVTETTGDWKLLHIDAPTAPYKLTANILFGPGMTYSTSGSLMGIGWKESDTDKFMACIAETGDHINFWKYTNPSTFLGTAATNNPVDHFWEELWIEAEDDNTDLIVRASMDGINFYEIGTEGRTVHMSSAGPDKLCWALNPRGSAGKLMSLRAWIEE